MNNLWVLMLQSHLICYFCLLSLRHWKILSFLKTEDGMNINMSTLHISSQIVGTVQAETLA